MQHELLVVLLLAVDCTRPVEEGGPPPRTPLPPLPPSSCLSRVACPAAARPACARLQYRRAGASARAHSVYVEMLNECEINYANCTPGVEAAVVPMKYCSHETPGKHQTSRKHQTPGKHQTPVKARRKRVKRDLATGVWHQAFHQPRRQILREPKRRQEEVEPPAADDGQEQEEQAPQGEQEAYPAGSPPGEASIQEGIEDVDYEAHVVEKLNASPEDEELTDNSIQQLDKPGGGSGGDEVGKWNGEHNKPVTKMDWPYSDSASAELIFSFHSKPKTSKINMDDEEPDMNEYQADCPKVCPARDVMVCARCQHSVYRTFLSVCHMRMFQCEHKDERLHLATRYPCVMSAPYLAEARMQPRGRVREHGDDDLVLRFIRCSALHDKSREDDPRCFLDKQKLMLQIETYNISDMY